MKHLNINNRSLIYLHHTFSCFWSVAIENHFSWNVKLKVDLRNLNYFVLAYIQVPPFCTRFLIKTWLILMAKKECTFLIDLIQNKNGNCMLQGNPCNKTPTDHP